MGEGGEGDETEEGEREADEVHASSGYTSQQPGDGCGDDDGRGDNDGSGDDDVRGNDEAEEGDQQTDEVHHPFWSSLFLE